jgi:2-succinyl-5-enolpyruvyl-6-hydroxy-3-cyclohexene-1-carboxylate synthase
MTGRPAGADVQAAFCAVLCDEWVRAGVTDAVVAPGSRSTPMVAALDAEDRIRVTVVLDERSAGFTALGMGLATGRPAVVVTTSGTASVELHPAVVEAAQALVPMIAVTTDRPPELHHVGAPQTVEQGGLFGGSPRWSVDPGVPEAESAPSWRSLAARSVAEATGSPAGPGPVHINLPFREPLLGHAAGFAAPEGRPGDAPWHRARPAGTGRPDAGIVDLLVSAAGRRGLIVAGHGAARPGSGASGGEGGAGGADAVTRLAAVLGWPVIADPRSACRVPSPWVVSAADALLRIPDFAAERPDVVLRLGAPPASKVLSQWLAALPADVPQVLADPWGRWADPERTAALLARADGADLLAALAGAVPDGTAAGVPGARAAATLGPAPAPTGPAPGPAEVAPGGWTARWMVAEAAARRAIDGLLAAGAPLELSEPAVAQSVVAAAAAHGGTVLASSSMPVRDVEWYAPPSSARVLANRGANGIDGVVSTALGVAAAGPDRPVVALVGDLAFLYDAGAMLWAGTRPGSLTIVVVDNDGGGIFSFLPQAKALPGPRFERYWGTPHGLDLTSLAGAYGVPAERAATRRDLERVLAAGVGAPGVRVVVVPSGRADNVAAHDRIHAAVTEAVTAAGSGRLA